MLRDGDFPRDDAKRLEYLRMSISDAGIVILDARKSAMNYLSYMKSEVGPEAREHLTAAADLHRQESETIGKAHDIIPWGNVKGDKLVARTERKNREAIAKVILECKGLYEKAMDHFDKALRAEGEQAGCSGQTSKE
jgi:hypothetical protein